MTGTRISLRRYTGCNLNWSAPDPTRGKRDFHDPPSRFNRRKIYIPPEHYPGKTKKYGNDRHGTYTWMINDCLYEWISTRPGIYHVLPLNRLFDRIHDHVHTPHREDRIYVFLPLKRATVTFLEALDAALDKIPEVNTELDSDKGTFTVRFHRSGGLGCRLRLGVLSSNLDERWHTDVWKRVNKYLIRVSLPALETDSRVTAMLADLEEPLVYPVASWPGRGSNRCKVSWIERASNPELARKQALEAVQDASLLGGSFWETPVKVEEP